MKKVKNWTNEILDVPYEKRKDVPDYLYLLSKGTSKEAREKFGCGDIFINAAVCLKCKDYIRSKNVHHFVTCSCGNLSADGGSYYCKRNFRDGEDSYIDCVELFTDLKKICEST